MKLLIIVISYQILANTTRTSMNTSPWMMISSLVVADFSSWIRKVHQQVLSQLYVSHLGSVRTKQRAHLLGLLARHNNDIDSNHVNDYAPIQSNTKEPIVQKSIMSEWLLPLIFAYIILHWLYLLDHGRLLHRLTSNHFLRTTPYISHIQQSFCYTAFLAPSNLMVDPGSHLLTLLKAGAFYTSFFTTINTW